MHNYYLNTCCVITVRVNARGKQKHDGCDMAAFKNNKVRVRRVKMLGNKEVANCLQGYNSSQPQAGSTHPHTGQYMASLHPTTRSSLTFI